MQAMQGEVEPEPDPAPEPEPELTPPKLEVMPQPVQAEADDRSVSIQLLQKTIVRYQKNPSIPKAHATAQRKYSVFCANRTADLYTTFFGLAGGIPDCSGATFSRSFTACVPFPGKKDEREVCGMVAGDGSGKIQGLVRYEYKGNIIEECRTAGKEHGLRVVCTQMGDIWIRVHSNGNRLAQIVLCADGSISACPKPIDDGGLDALRCHLHMIQECFKPS